MRFVFLTVASHNCRGSQRAENCVTLKWLKLVFIFHDVTATRLCDEDWNQIWKEEACFCVQGIIESCSVCSRCGEEPSPECDIGGCAPLWSSCRPTGATRSSPTSARSTVASKTCAPWGITAGTWSGPRPRKSCGNLRRHSRASTTGTGREILL